ncbi:zinc finger domain-containing protein [Clostridium beijerinckii]|nr:zinc finger domain-containing protein [Clostridium beijerinckii]NRU69133.1 DnaJ-class molecular chaperone [Clostridium beijerinckii]
MLEKHENAEEGIIQVIEKYLTKSREILCPLCEGSGTHNSWECPVCRGIGTVDYEVIDNIDLAPYMQEECLLCKGRGTHNNRECPICRGARTVDCEELQFINVAEFKRE